MSSSSASVCKGDITVTQQILASSAGALMTSLMVTPMDVVKIRLQSQLHPLIKGECFLYSNGLMDHLCISCSDPRPNGKCEWFNRPSYFSGTIDAFVKISRHEGMRSLWSGLTPTMLSAIPATVFYFTVYDNLLCALQQRMGERVYVPLFAGTLARAVAVTVVSPLEMVRTKMQSEPHTFRDLKHVLSQSLRNEGYATLFRGWTATLLRDIPFSGLYWSGYEFLKTSLLSYLGREKTNFYVSFACGATSGTIAAVLTLPFDVVKTHRQISLGKQVTEGKSPVQFRNTATLPIMKEIVRAQGYRALFAGIVPRIAKVAPACAIMIGSYEYLKLFFNRRNQHRHGL